MADEHLAALRTSVTRLHELADMDEKDLVRGAYPSEWSIADVLSHLGSGAVIMHRRLDDALAGRDTPDDFALSVWMPGTQRPPSPGATTASARTPNSSRHWTP